MREILLVSGDKLFAHMLELELSGMPYPVRIVPNLLPAELETAVLGHPVSLPSVDDAAIPTAEPESINGFTADTGGIDGTDGIAGTDAPSEPAESTESAESAIAAESVPAAESAAEAPVPAFVPGDDGCRLLILDLDVAYTGLEKMLSFAEEQQLPVILFGYPDSDAMTADKLRFYDSDIYRYVFQRPFLVHQFLYCAKELLHYRDDEILRKKEVPAMKMKQRSPADDIRFNEGYHQIFYKNDIIQLTPSEYEIIVYLMKRRGDVISRAELFDAIRKPKADEDVAPKKKKNSNVVDVYIRYIRSKIDDRYGVRLIETVRGTGYTIPK
ncbi:MAG: winged-helix domain-containing protein [Clostridia bacterium]|nr:winged-helix domain-containing protein [Clostridia bacterium]